MQTFYWHDYETWGINPSADWPSQFAGIRTDWNLQPIGEPLNIKCKPPSDSLPSLQAALVTGLSPSQTFAEGLLEPDFFAAVHSELAKPQTCGAGYNSIRFDDEVTRYGFYRNFIDPYAREWQSGCSRWDIVDLVRLCYAVRPDGFDWPMLDAEDGKQIPSLKLERICQLNGIEHSDAHDALSDVYATIELARRIKAAQPKMFSFVLEMRNKQQVLAALALGSHAARLHISSKFGAANANASLILPLVADPRNKNEIHCIDLRHDPSPLLELSAEELAECRYRRIDELPTGVGRIALKSVHLNRAPIVLTPKLLTDEVASRCDIDVQQCEAHRLRLLGDPKLPEKIVEMARLATFDGAGRDVDAALYDGFMSGEDRSLCQQIIAMSADDLATQNFSFSDKRLPELLFRYRARNYYETLAVDEQALWQEHLVQKVTVDRSEFVAEQMALAQAVLSDASESDGNKKALGEEFLALYEALIKKTAP